MLSLFAIYRSGNFNPVAGGGFYRLAGSFSAGGDVRS